MAISRILHINSHEHSSSSHLQVAINYILKDEKTMNGLLTGSVNCIKEDAYENMKATKKLFGKTDKRQGYHLIISFAHKFHLLSFSNFSNSSLFSISDKWGMSNARYAFVYTNAFLLGKILKPLYLSGLYFLCYPYVFVCLEV